MKQIRLIEEIFNVKIFLKRPIQFGSLTLNKYILKTICDGLILLIIFLGFTVGCQSLDTSLPVSSTSLPNISSTNTPSLIFSQTPYPGPTVEIVTPQVPTPIPTSTNKPKPTSTNTLTPTPSPTRIGGCADRRPGDDLLTLVTLDYGLSRDYQPADLVPLSDYFSNAITRGYPNEVREVIIEPLSKMLDAMTSSGLHPKIISGYRSYSTQAIAYTKWLNEYPDRVNILSAPPGFSEHQLGTTIDFGSPELPGIVGQEDIEFHTYFYKTSEGIWLEEHAHEFGFTLSYPLQAFEETGFYYEPWHFRYVGIDIATTLKNENKTLTKYLLETQGPPCIP